jgi:hypothetical protein
MHEYDRRAVAARVPIPKSGIGQRRQRLLCGCWDGERHHEARTCVRCALARSGARRDRREQCEAGKAVGAKQRGIALNEHTEADGATVFRQACVMGLEGIVSKRLSAPYPALHPAVCRHPEECGRVQPLGACFG